MILEQLKKQQIPFSLKTIIWGWKKGFICKKEVEDFLLENYYNNANLADLILSVEDNDMLDAISKIFITFNIKEDDLTNEWRKFRFVKLSDIYERHENIKEASDIYSEFDYPQDMESFIYYMPLENSNSMNLWDNLERFLDYERHILINC